MRIGPSCCTELPLNSSNNHQETGQQGLKLFFIQQWNPNRSLAKREGVCCTQSCTSLDGQAEPLHPWHQGAAVSKPEASPEPPPHHRSTTAAVQNQKRQIGKAPLRTETCHTAKEQQEKSSPPTNTLQAPPAQHLASPAPARVTFSKSSLVPNASGCLADTGIPGLSQSSQ